MHCFAFLKGKCEKGDNCLFGHVSAETVKELKRANAAQAKAKAEPKAKAKAKAGAFKPIAPAEQE